MNVSALRIGGREEAWSALGFDVDADGTAAIGSVRIELSPDVEEGSIASWALDGPDVPDRIDGLRTDSARRRDPGSPHPNGVCGIDHLVVLTPSLERTTAAFAEIGVDCRRVRDAGNGVRQGFFLVGDFLVEVVAGAEGDPDDPARFWGLTLVVGDIDATAELLGDKLGAVKDAVQPGRRIATVRKEATGGLPLALMTRRT